MRKKIPAPKGSMAKRKKERGGGEARSGPEGTRVGDRKELEEGELGGGSALDPTSAPAGTQGRLVQQQLLPVDLHQARPQPMDEKPTWRRPRTTDKKTLVEEWVENVSSNGSNRWDDWLALAQPAPY